MICAEDNRTHLQPERGLWRFAFSLLPDSQGMGRALQHSQAPHGKASTILRPGDAAVLEEQGQLALPSYFPMLVGSAAQPRAQPTAPAAPTSSTS